MASEREVSVTSELLTTTVCSLRRLLISPYSSSWEQWGSEDFSYVNDKLCLTFVPCWFLIIQHPQGPSGADGKGLTVSTHVPREVRTHTRAQERTLPSGKLTAVC